MKKQLWKVLPVILFILISGSCYSCSFKNEAKLIPLVPESEAGTVLPAEPAAVTAAAETETAGTTAAVCYVYVCGAVLEAGVYEVPEGERVFRVLELAGGYTEEAAAEYLNLASTVTDGMRLFVPTKEEFEQMGGAVLTEQAPESAGTLAGDRTGIDLNKASKEELMTLTGIGEAKADAIIKYRQESGGFDRIEDIMNISGIKQSAFDKIKDRIIVAN